MLFDRGGSMRRTRWAAGVGAGLLATLAVPAGALAGLLVMFMQAGFAFLEIGFSRGKNAGTVVAKILVNFSICALCFYAVGFAFSFGAGNQIIRQPRFF